ncbi:hypothetical protein TRVL_04144 [Trypanosoma vivax]|nr:hypothetical protein TRVL_04144 [Trypanosoma vivax]
MAVALSGACRRVFHHAAQSPPLSSGTLAVAFMRRCYSHVGFLASLRSPIASPRLPPVLSCSLLPSPKFGAFTVSPANVVYPATISFAVHRRRARRHVAHISHRSRLPAANFACSPCLVRPCVARPRVVRSVFAPPLSFYLSPNSLVPFSRPPPNARIDYKTDSSSPPSLASATRLPFCTCQPVRTKSR